MASFCDDFQNFPGEYVPETPRPLRLGFAPAALALMRSPLYVQALWHVNFFIPTKLTMNI